MLRFPDEMGSQEHHADQCTLHNDTLTAGRLADECLWEAQGENLSAAEVTDAAGGNLLTFMVSELNRAADRDTDPDNEGEWE
jgi:hypothetical protein